MKQTRSVDINRDRAKLVQLVHSGTGPLTRTTSKYITRFISAFIHQKNVNLHPNVADYYSFIYPVSQA